MPFHVWLRYMAVGKISLLDSPIAPRIEAKLLEN